MGEGFVSKKQLYRDEICSSICCWYVTKYLTVQSPSVLSYVCCFFLVCANISKLCGVFFPLDCLDEY